MKPPPPSIESYMQSIKGGAGGGPFGGPGGQFGGGAVNPALQHVFQQESEKMRQMQQML